MQSCDEKPHDIHDSERIPRSAIIYNFTRALFQNLTLHRVVPEASRGKDSGWGRTYKRGRKPAARHRPDWKKGRSKNSKGIKSYIVTHRLYAKRLRHARSEPGLPQPYLFTPAGRISSRNRNRRVHDRRNRRHNRHRIHLRRRSRNRNRSRRHGVPSSCPRA